jgi:membrane-associated phospholipid phosphatase
MRVSFAFAGVFVCLGVLLNSFVLFNQSLFLSLNALFPHQTFWTVITTIGDGAVAGCIFYLVMRKNNLALTRGFVAAVMGVIASNGLKHLFAVPRPEHTPGFERPFHLLVEPMSVTSFSMPSGHTLAAFLLGTLLFHFLKLNWPAKILLGLLLVLIGLSRIALGVHWPADVFAGAGLGIFIGLACGRLPVEITNKKGIVVVHLLYLAFVISLLNQYVF